MFCTFFYNVLQLSQIWVSQGSADTIFAVLRLFRKVSQIKVSQGFQNTSFAVLRLFRKVSQIGFSFRKVYLVKQVSQGFRNGQFADVLMYWGSIYCTLETSSSSIISCTGPPFCQAGPASLPYSIPAVDMNYPTSGIWTPLISFRDLCFEINQEYLWLSPVIPWIYQIHVCAP